MQFTDQPNVTVALVYQSQALHQHLRAALDEFGARIVYETATSSFDQAALDQSGATVVLINLDPAIDEEIEQIEQLMFDDSRTVIFNDGEVTSKLGGWDLARWARHLAAKIIGDKQLLPARPAGAEAVPVREMPQHGLDSIFKPEALQAPVVSIAAEDLASREIGDALDGFETISPLGSEERGADEQAREELQAALSDFGFFSNAETPIAVNELAAQAEPVFERFDDPVVVDEPISESINVQSFEPVHELPGDGELIEASVVFETTAASADSASDLNQLFADFSFDEAITDASESDIESASLTDDEAAAFADIQFDMDVAPARASADAVVDLDDFLAQHTLKSDDVTVELPVPATPTTKASPRAAVDIDTLLSNLSLELSPLDEAQSAASEAAPDKAVAAAPSTATTQLASDFDSVLSSLSLQPMQDEEVDEALAVDAKPAATATSTANSLFDGLDFGLEPMASEVEDDKLVSEMNPFADLGFETDSAPAATTSAAGNTAQSAAASGAVSRVWVLGASIGGPDAVREFLAGIPDNTNNLFVLAQHMGADFVDLMVSQLSKATVLDVTMAASGATARNGQVLVVPLAERMLLEADGSMRIVPLDDASPYSPSIDQVLFDIADRFGARAGAIIFSGMAHDAIEGAKYLAAKGGVVWTQDPASCVVSSMIDGAVEAGIVSFQGSPAVLAQKFVSEFR